MKMEKADIKNRINSMRENSKNNPNKNNLKNPNDKECPFRDQVCDSRCRLFRDKKGYECPFMEVSSISWNFKKLVEELIGKK